MSEESASEQYDVALSFAGEDRTYVEEVANILRSRGVSVFYDRFEEADFWGKDLYDYFTDIYQNRAKYVILFISSHYKEKIWANQERRAAQSKAISKALTEDGEYILPARFDDTELQGVLSTTAYIDLRERTPTELSVLVCKKLGRAPFSTKANQVPPPKSAADNGEIAFDYSSHDGKYLIGIEPFEFETIWSKASGDSIHCYTDTPSVRGVAVPPPRSDLEDITDASVLDMTSRVRTAVEGGVVVLQNHNGFYAGLQILDIKDDTRPSDDRDELRFRYWILKDGSSDFSRLDDEHLRSE